MFCPARHITRRKESRLTGGVRTGLIPVVRLARRRLLAIVVLSCAGGLCEAAVLVLVAQIAAQIAAGGRAPTPLDVGPLSLDTASAGTLLAVASGCVVARLCCQLGSAAMAAAGAAAVGHTHRTAAVVAFLEASWDVQSQEPEGGLSHLAGQEVDRTATAALYVGAFATAVCNVMMLVIVAIWVSPVAAALTLVAVLVLYAGLRPLSRRTGRAARSRSRGEREVLRTVDETVRTAEEVRVFGIGRAVAEQAARESADVAHQASRVYRMGLSVSVLYQSAALALIIAALAAINATEVARPGALAAIVFVLLRAFAYSQQAQAAYHLLSEYAPSARRVADESARYRRHRQPVGHRRLPAITSLRLADAGYVYPPGRVALEGVDLEIPVGATVGVIGPSGSGKSTLVQVLLRLRSPTSGAYLVNDRPAVDYRADDWTQQVSYVPQEPKLVAGTVADNIRFFRPDIDDDAIVRAARAAHIHDEVVAWPSGYATSLGARGAAVSGGQRQRLCLARALAAHPSLLVLDEPTSALDVRSETLVQQSLRELTGSITIVIVAHRLSTLAICDWLVVLAGGCVEMVGPPAELAAAGGFYRETLQLSGLS
jgi:ABC-type multidrug transport system fused ATPase/permease subunit